MMKLFGAGIVAALVLLDTSQAVSGATLSGELRQWHKTTLTFAGPSTSETAGTNPFLDYRLDVTFTQGDKSYTVPGYYAADGDAGNTGASAGNKWRVHFSPPSTGTWDWQASFRRGAGIAVSSAAGTSTHFDGQSGSFDVSATNKSGDDFRGKGLIQLAPGKHYLQFSGTGQYWIKGGTDSPEDFLGYSEFDNTTSSSSFATTTYPSHVGDWNSGDPTWRNGKGKGIIGALNYLGSQKVNSIYFLPMNLGGDGENTHPFASTGSDLVYDCSKLDQWGMVFDHAQKNGILPHVVLNEAEAANRNRLDGGTLGTERKLFYRELAARFGHVNGLMWNICEEGVASFGPASIMKSFADYVRSVDPYDHPIGVHNWIKEDGIDAVFADFYGHPSIDYLSIQYRSSYIRSDYPDPRYPNVLGDLRADTASAGKPLALMGDELEMTRTSDDESYSTGVVAQGGMQWQRKGQLWQWYLGGGAGVEYILSTVLDTHDFRQYEPLWRYTRYARDFMEQIPFGDMVPSHDLLTGESTYSRSNPKISGVVLAKPGEVYAIQLPNASSTGTLDLSDASGTFTMRWYNPRTGTFEGGIITIDGGGMVSLGSPPSSPSEDWVILIESTVTPVTAIWDNNGGGGNLQWETPTNWDPDGKPDATSRCTIDNGDIVDLSRAGELAKSIELGQTTPTTLNVSGNLTVSTAANVGEYGTLNVSGGLTTGEFNSAGSVTIGAAATDATGVGLPSLGAVVVTGGSINSAVEIDTPSLNIDTGSVTSVGATVAGGATVTGGGSLDTGTGLFEAASLNVSSGGSYTGTGGLVAATVTVADGALSTVGGTIGVSLDVSGTGSAEVGGVAVPLVAVDATGSVTAANAMTVSDKIVMGGSKTISISAGHTFGAAGTFSDHDDDARTLTLDTAGSTLTIGVSAAGTPGLSYIPVTNDADSEVDPAKTYTHAIDFGGGAPVTVNGVTFVKNFGDTGGTASLNTGSTSIGIQYNGRDFATVTGAVYNLFRDMRYGAAAAEVILTGLTPGQWYDFRLYSRSWDTNGEPIDDRSQNFEYYIGDATVAADTVSLNQDDASADPPGLDAYDRAYAMSYVYQADAAGKITVKIDQTGDGTYHNYGLTNELALVEERGLTWPNTDIVVTADSTLHVLGGEPATLGNLSVLSGASANLSGAASVSFRDVSGGGGIVGSISVRGEVNPGDGIGQLDAIGDVALEAGASLAPELQGSEADLLYVDGLLGLTAPNDAISPSWVPGADASSMFGGTYVVADTGGIDGEFDVLGGGNIGAAYISAVAYDVELPSGGLGIAVTLHAQLVGDVDLDGEVARGDFLALRGGFGSAEADWSDGDLTFDGAANYLDYIALKRTMGDSVPPGGGITPEPATLFVMMAAGLPALRKRRRRS
jgi:hypothetical protein